MLGIFVIFVFHELLEMLCLLDIFAGFWSVDAESHLLYGDYLCLFLVIACDEYYGAVADGFCVPGDGVCSGHHLLLFHLHLLYSQWRRFR